VAVLFGFQQKMIIISNIVKPFLKRNV